MTVLATPFLPHRAAVCHPVARAIAASLVAIALLMPLPAGAQVRPTTIEWDANTDGLTAGYAVFVGISPGTPLATFNVGGATRAVLPLPLGGRYFVAVRGYDASGSLGPSSVEAEIDLSAAPGGEQDQRDDASRAPFFSIRGDVRSLRAPLNALAVFVDQSLHDLEDPPLLVAGQPANNVERALCLAERAGAFGGSLTRTGVDADDVVDAHVEALRQERQHVAARRLLAPFPVSNVGVRDSDRLS